MGGVPSPTERLGFREFETRDGAFVARLVNEPGWLRFIGDRGARSAADAQRMIDETYRPAYAEHGYGMWVVELRGSAEPIGVCGLVNRPTLPGPDLGFAFLEAHAGKGYATEAGRATLAYAFTERGIGRVLAITSVDNAASIRVLEKLGFVFEGERALEEGAEAVRVFVWEGSRGEAT